MKPLSVMITPHPWAGPICTLTVQATAAAATFRCCCSSSSNWSIEFGTPPRSSRLVNSVASDTSVPLACSLENSCPKTAGIGVRDAETETNG